MPAGHVTLSVVLPNYGSLFGPHDWHRFVDLGRAADDAGVDRVIVVDHVVMGTSLEQYRWGAFPTAPDAPWLEPHTLVAAMAAVTTRVRLATNVTIAPLRPAALLAKQSATIDVMSRGRFDLGVGAGWQPAEYAAQNLDFSQRGQLLTDTLGACKALWTQSPATFTSPTLSFGDIYCEPKPLQSGGVPLWVAGTLHPRNLDRIVRYGDAWVPIMGASLDDIARGVHVVHGAWEAAGRDPTELQVRAPLPLVRRATGTVDIARSLDAVERVTGAGVTDVTVHLSALVADVDAAPVAFAEFARAFAAATR
ncbi:MAG: putative FMN-dependent monooxygenase [Actinomycetia bacterium]|nr:putative FMN-dependent monooxygenase [Actinomycetes bacterium]